MTCRSTQHWVDRPETKIEGEVWPFEVIETSPDDETGTLKTVDLTGVTFRFQIRSEAGGTLIHTQNITPVKEEVEDYPTEKGPLTGEFWIIRANIDLGSMSETTVALPLGTYTYGLWETAPRTIARVQGSLVIRVDFGGGEE